MFSPLAYMAAVFCFKDIKHSLGITCYYFTQHSGYATSLTDLSLYSGWRLEPQSHDS